MDDSVRTLMARAVAGMRAWEVLENLTRSMRPWQDTGATPRGSFWYDDDGNFWRATGDGRVTFDTEVEFGQVALSEWRARVPGLYWTPEAQRLHEIGDPALGGEEIVAGRAAMRPLGKSVYVLQGGVGTLPPEGQAVQGYRACTLTTTCNASAGVPAMIPSALWGRRRRELAEAVVVRGRGIWRSLPGDWSSVLPRAGRPVRGVLVVTELESLQTTHRVWVHPFDVMSYVEDGALFYDFVYAEMFGDASDPERAKVLQFFTEYAARAGRAGRYLLGLGGGPGTGTHPDDGGELRNIRARVEGFLGEDPTIQALVVGITQVCQEPARLKLLGHDAGITPALWVNDREGLGNQVHALVEAARRERRVPELVAVLAGTYPTAWTDARGRAGRRA